jgi:hypothetical protein
MFALSVWAVFLLTGSFCFSQHSMNGLKSITEMDSLFIGWLNDPDTLVVYVDTSYT